MTKTISREDDTKTALASALNESGIKIAEQIVKPIDCTKATVAELRKAIKTRQPISGVTMLITHQKCHADEMLGMDILRRGPGEKFFPGIADASIAFQTEIELIGLGANGKDGWYEGLRNGALIIGTGKGFFDEHMVREKDPSCAHIVADYVGIFHDPTLRKVYGPLLSYIDFEDRNGDRVDAILKLLPQTEWRHAYAIKSSMLASIIKDAWKVIETQEEMSSLFAVVSHCFSYQIKSQKKFHVEGRESYEKADKKIIPLTFLPKGERGKEKVLLVIKTDSYESGAFAQHSFRGKEKEELAVLLTINSKGQFYMKSMNKLSLVEVLKVLRNTIIRKRNARVDWSMMDKEASIAEVPEIYFHKDSGDLMNGSKTQPDVPGLLTMKDGLTEAELIEAVKIGLNPTRFEIVHEKDCKNGVCPAQNGKYKCPLKSAGLKRCHDVRKGIKVAKTECAVKK